MSLSSVQGSVRAEPRTSSRKIEVGTLNDDRGGLVGHLVARFGVPLEVAGNVADDVLRIISSCRMN